MVLFQVLNRVTIFCVAESRPSEHTSGHHADATHDRHRDRTSIGKTVSDNSQHGWPEEGLANRINR